MKFAVLTTSCNKTGNNCNFYLAEDHFYLLKLILFVQFHGSGLLINIGHYMWLFQVILIFQSFYFLAGCSSSEKDLTSQNQYNKTYKLKTTITQQKHPHQQQQTNKQQQTKNIVRSENCSSLHFQSFLFFSYWMLILWKRAYNTKLV